MVSRSCEDILMCMQDSKFHKKISTALNSQRIGDIDSHNICRIHVHARSFDWTQPPNRNKGGSGTGTGFLLDQFPISDDNEVFILTCHHVVAHSVQIRVNFSKLTSEYSDALLVGCNPDMDVALLVVKDAEFAATLRTKKSIGLTCGLSDNIRPSATVTAHGFALGKPHMQTTKGVVSGRIDNPSRLQTDVAVNPGNSGGPLMDDTNTVIGLVTSGMVDAQGINYVAPIHEVSIVAMRIMQKWRSTGSSTPYTERLPSLNCAFTKSNRVLLNPIKGCKSGVFCTSVHPIIEYPQSKEAALSNLMTREWDEATLHTLESAIQQVELHSVMTRACWMKIFKDASIDDPLTVLEAIRNETIREGDIVCSMGVGDKTYDIDLQMTSKFDFWPDNIGFAAILDRLDCIDGDKGDSVRLDFYRGGHEKQVHIPLYPQMNTFRLYYADVDAFSYMVMAGVFVMPLLHNHISLFRHESMHTLMSRPDTRHESVLILSHILPESPFNECETIGAGDVLVAINNTPTFTVNDCLRAWEKEMAHGPDHVITLRMRDGSLASASVAQITTATDRITSEYNSSGYAGHHTIGSETQIKKLRSKRDNREKFDSTFSTVPSERTTETAASETSQMSRTDDGFESTQGSLAEAPMIGKRSLRTTGCRARSNASANSTLSSLSDRSDPKIMARMLMRSL